MMYTEENNTTGSSPGYSDSELQHASTSTSTEFIASEQSEYETGVDNVSRPT